MDAYVRKVIFCDVQIDIHSKDVAAMMAATVKALIAQVIKYVPRT